MMGLAGKLSPPSLPGAMTVACEVAAFSALGCSLAWMMWALVEPTGPLPRSAQAAQQADPFDRLASRLSRIPDVGMSRAGDAPATAQDASGFTLFSARAGAGGDGTAILSVGGAPQASFSVGDEVAPGARLVRVSRDRVEIDVGGQSIHVEFQGAQPSIPPLQAPQSQAPAPRPASAALINSLSLQPVSKPDGRSGFEVTSRADLALLSASGLRAGDVVLRVNGVDISSANLAEQTAQLQAGRSLEIVYERNGQISTTRIGRPDQ